MSMRPIAWLAVALALASCAGAPSPSEAAHTGTSTPAESDCIPPPSIGTYDAAAFEDALGVGLLSEVQSNGWLSYEYTVDGNFHFSFAVNPGQDAAAIVSAAAHIDDARIPLTEQEHGMEEAWFALVAVGQPDAAAWLREEVGSYVPLTGVAGASTQWVEGSDGTCVRVMAGTFMWWYPDQPDHWVFWEITTDWPTMDL
jgi:hypothetical protein